MWIRIICIPPSVIGCMYRGAIMMVAKPAIGGNNWKSRGMNRSINIQARWTRQKWYPPVTWRDGKVQLQSCVRRWWKWPMWQYPCPQKWLRRREKRGLKMACTYSRQLTMAWIYSRRLMMAPNNSPLLTIYCNTCHLLMIGCNNRRTTQTG